MSTDTAPAPDLNLGQVTVEYSPDGHTATLLIDRAAKLNALTLNLLDELAAAVREVASSKARLVIVRTAGEKVFCVGADINHFADLSAAGMWRDWIATGHRAFDALAGLRQPSIAVIDGLAFGGGLELALACDFRVIAAEARLALPETGLGTVPGWGGTKRATELIGRARAKELVLTRRQLTGDEAVSWGLATAVAPKAELQDAVARLAGELLAGAPLAVQLGKQLIDAAADGAPSRVLEALAGGLAAATDDLAEGVAAFRGKRTAQFTDN
ncbi:enoyl-CoA hydratase/isomerase family protein [Arthrobacter sp. ISL-28]|uniref:enoyl-CoA hydratase/isomerase family protein n=1 Tax=Arthrobacter sp. ISL-28 TaxID=2819108 RepID=UPI001BE74988|nr:enoyl-CoA hydratase/isomerase family protein [Arthrobacter sp. ISL-28]MBT2522532.1 enoyl-CoA hydratase/isomerase family protein [Arthrobacter sp. ISL-28]